MTGRVHAYLALHVAAASTVLVGSIVLAARSTDVPFEVVAGVIVSGLVVTRFPLVHGTGRARQVYVVDGGIFAMAVLLLPPAWAVLALTAPSLTELASGRRPIDRRVLFPAATATGHAVAVAAYLLVAAEASIPVQLAAATAGSYLSMAVYNGFVGILLRLRGRRLPTSFLRFLSPMPTMYGGSILPGLIIGVVGRDGPAAFAFALLCAGAFYLLYWQYRRMANASDRMDALFAFTAQVHTLATTEEVEHLATEVTQELLTSDDAVITSTAPIPPQTAAPLVVAGRARWLVAVRHATALQSISPREDSKLIEAVAQVTAHALEKLLLAQQLRREARHDALTGVMNRVAFEEACERLTARSVRSGPKAARFALCYGDLDGFKPINDRWGHDVGDEVLRIVAARLRATVRAGDEIARVGGDEFLLLLHDVADADAADAAIAHVREAVSQPMTVGDRALEVGISFGAALWPKDGAHVHELMQVADRRMYDAKRARRAMVDG